MPSPAGASLFLLGLASGLSLLTLTAYRRVSPIWLKWLLIASALVVFSRYVAEAAWCSPTLSPERLPVLRHVGWFATWLGLILPSVFAVDQLLRHPSMTPKKLLVRCLPFLAAAFTAAPFEWLRWIYQGIVALAFAVICALLMRKIPSRPIRLALLGLVIGQCALTLGSLYGEMALLLALWFAYETAADAVFS